jgi:hypothetical protein
VDSYDEPAPYLGLRVFFFCELGDMAMARFAAVLTFAALCSGLVPLHAEEAPAKKLVGAWERKVEQTTIKFDFQKDSLRVTLTTPDGTIDVDSAYGLTKKGVVFGIVQNVEKKGATEGPSEGDLFSFQVSVDNDSLTIKELKGTSANDDAKRLIEGEYKKAAGK